MSESDNLTTPSAIREAMLRAETREPTDAEYDGMDGLDRVDYFVRGYKTALQEFAMRLPWAGQVWTDAPIEALGDPAKPPYPGAPIREARVVGMSGKTKITLDIGGKRVDVSRGRVFLLPGRAEWNTPQVMTEMVQALLKDRR